MTITDTPVAPVDNGVNVDSLLGARSALSEQPAAAQFTWRAVPSFNTGRSDWPHATTRGVEAMPTTLHFRHLCPHVGKLWATIHAGG